MTSVAHRSREDRAAAPGGLPRLARSRPVCRRVYVHIGEPKTGTTFLQDVMWRNRVLLADRGVVLPGYERRDHVRARRDLRSEAREEADLADRWEGEWDVLAGQALRAPEAAIISDEMMATCTAPQIGRAVASLAPAEVHVVLTVRAFGSILPAHWQEVVKCGGSPGWQEWLARIRLAAADEGRREMLPFWAAHDTPAILAAWMRHVPAERVHVITTPPRPEPQLLWARMAAVLGIDPAGVSLNTARANSSLGYAQTEILRRINEALPDDIPDWFYTRHVKPVLAQRVLPALPPAGRPLLPPDAQAWAAGQAERITAGLRESGCHIVGDLSELLPGDRPAAAAAGPALPAAELPAVAPAGTAEQAAAELALPAEAAAMVDAAVASAVGLSERLYHRLYPAPQRAPHRALRQAVKHAAWSALRGKWVTRQLRRGSRLRPVQRLRVTIWCVIVRPGRYRPALPAQPAAVADDGRAADAA